MSTRQHDHTTFAQKVRLRNRVLSWSGTAVDVLETHGGFGRVYERTWYRATRGAVIEQEADKVEHLARQRPSWSVYEGDSLKALRAGLFRSRAFDIVDIDPFGSSLDYMAEMFAPERARPAAWWMVVNCGLRHTLELKQAWRVNALQDLAKRHGATADYFHRYLDAVQVLMREHAAKVGQRVAWFDGYYCGHAHQMTHYAARIEAMG